MRTVPDPHPYILFIVEPAFPGEGIVLFIYLEITVENHSRNRVGRTALLGSSLVWLLVEELSMSKEPDCPISETQLIMEIWRNVLIAVESALLCVDAAE